ncbi:Serine--tRNA ligase, cytoplasmic [Linum perenne]
MFENNPQSFLPKQLNLPYQVIAIVSGALNDAAAKKFDLEACNEAAKQYVHLLNSTLTATERTMCCILENYQKEDGVEIPEVLRPYMGGISFMPFQKGSKGKKAK